MTSSHAVVGPITWFMIDDHVRIDRLLEAAENRRRIFIPAIYDHFRRGLLRHIAMEEKVLLPYARAKRGGVDVPMARTLHEDHGQLAKLLARSPTAENVDALRELLLRHDALEEAPDGLYAICDELAGDEAYAVVERLRDQPPVPVAKYYDRPAHRYR